MENVHNLKSSIVRGLRAGLLSFLFLLMLDILILHQDNIMNFVMILVIVFICSFLVGMTFFLFKYSKLQQNMKVIAWVVLLVTLIVVGFLQYPFVNHIVPKNFETMSKTQIKIGIGKIDNLGPDFQESLNNAENEHNGDVQIGIS